MSELPGYLRLAKEEARRAPEDDLARRYLPLAVGLANQIRPPRLDDDERIGVANLALVEAARRYPTSKAARKGIPFAHYAALRIRDALWQAYRATWVAYVPDKVARRARRLRQAAARLAEGYDRPPTDEELAAALGWPVEQVARLRQLHQATEALSLDAHLPGDEKEEETFADHTADPLVDVEAEVIERIDAQREYAALAQAIERLPPIMRATISLRVGLPVSSTQRLTVDEVLRVAAGASQYTDQAVKKLRGEHADAIRPGASSLVGDGGQRALDLGPAPSSPLAAPRQHFAQDFWRRLADSGNLPPALAPIAQ